MRRILLFIIAAFVMTAALPAQILKSPARQCLPVTAAEKKTATHPVRLVLKSIDSNNGSGVTRIGIELLSMPSTSSRIDSVILRNGKRAFRAEDIDGVDFGRYFQWEETGSQYVELDFPKQKKIAKGAAIDVYTVHGTYTLGIKK